jgi:hypothetical protein
MNASRLLQRLRSLDCECDKQETKRMRLIARCKARLAPEWAARKAELRHAAGQRMLRTWA